MKKDKRSHSSPTSSQPGAKKSRTHQGPLAMPTTALKSNAPKISSQDEYKKIKSKLTYGLFDWAITDSDAREVLQILGKMSDTNLDATIHRMELEGLVARLMENISGEDQQTNKSLIAKIKKKRRAASFQKHIQSLLSYGFLDWAITDSEAKMVLGMFKDLRTQPEKFKEVITKIPQKQYERFFDNLSVEDRQANLRFIQEIELVRQMGMTLEEMSDEHKKFLEEEASKQGMSVGEYIHAQAQKGRLGGKNADKWTKLSDEKKEEWVVRFTKARDLVKQVAPPHILSLILKAEKSGGGITFKPKKTEKLGAVAYYNKIKGEIIFGVGMKWIEAVEDDPSLVFANIAHEIGGHGSFGQTFTDVIMDDTMEKISKEEKEKANKGPKKVYHSYGYPETEIYSELREFPYSMQKSPGDKPASDIRNKLCQLRLLYSPQMFSAIAESFRRRLTMDPNISEGALQLFDSKLSEVKGLSETACEEFAYGKKKQAT